MNKRRILLLAFFQCLLFSSVFAQKKQVTGSVIDSANGELLSGVTVLGDKKGIAASTKADGTFTIQVDSKVSILIFSSVGYTSKSYPVNNVPAVISLGRSSAALDEVVVIGYGTQRKSSVTGAVSKYRNERLDESPVSRIDQA